MRYTAGLLPLIFLAWSGLVAHVRAQGIDFRPQYLHAVLDSARAEGKTAVFVDVFATWCRPCHYMDDAVFTQDAVGTYFNRYFASVQLDAEVGEGIAFAAQHGVKAYPTLLLLDLEGRVLGRHEGVLEGQPLITWAGAVMAAQGSDEKGRSSKNNTRPAKKRTKRAAR